MYPKSPYLILRKGDRIEFTSTVLHERIIGVTTSSIIIAVSSLFFPHTSETRLWQLFIVVFFIVLIITILFSKKASRLLARLPLQHNYFKKFIKLLRSLSLERDQYPALVKSTLISTVFLFVGILSSKLYFMDLGYDLKIIHIAFVMPLISIISLIPISPNAIGLKEVSYSLLFGYLGVTTTDAVTVAVLARIILVAASVPGGILLIIDKRLKLSEKDIESIES